MKIETKFNIGDVVYVCKNNSTYEKEQCNICEGKGVITLKGKLFCCPGCHGDKFTHTKKEISYIPEKRTIRKIISLVSENNGNIRIHTRYETKPEGCGNIEEDRNTIFTTKEEVEDRCKELIAEESANFCKA